MHFYELIIVVNTAVSKTSSRFEEPLVLFLSVARGVEGEGVEGEGAASRVTFSRIYIESQVGVALNQDFIRIKLRFSLGTTAFEWR